MGHRAPGRLGSAGTVTDRLHTPLSHAQWCRGLRDVARACPHVPASQQEKLIRKMGDLLVRAPERAALAGVAVPDRLRLEALLAACSWETAALALLGEDTGYLFSRGESGCHLASILLPERFEETTCAGNTLALALVGALASTLSVGAILTIPQHRARASRYLH